MRWQDRSLGVRRNLRNEEGEKADENQIVQM